MESLLRAPDDFLHVLNVPAKSNLAFEIDGILFNAKLHSTVQTPKLVIWGLLGYLPYSVTDSAKRRDLLTIIDGARGLPDIAFGLDPSMRIVVQGTYRLLKPVPPNYLFEPLTVFIQRAKPFIRLIGERL